MNVGRVPSRGDRPSFERRPVGAPGLQRMAIPVDLVKPAGILAEQILND
jgi:hypothetical protein